MNTTRRIDAEERAEPSANGRVAIKGRGTVWAIQHRFSQQVREGYDDGWGTLDQHATEETLPASTTIIEERVKSILASNDSPDIPFDLSVNPYRGCEHVMRSDRPAALARDASSILSSQKIMNRVLRVFTCSGRH